MEDSKPFWMSKTLWGAVIAALPSLLGIFGIHVTDVGAFDTQATNLADQAITLAGTILAVYGRLTIKTPALTVTKDVPPSAAD